MPYIRRDKSNAKPNAQVTRAMEAGLTDQVWEIGELVSRLLNEIINTDNKGLVS